MVPRGVKVLLDDDGIRTGYVTFVFECHHRFIRQQYQGMYSTVLPFMIFFKIPIINDNVTVPLAKSEKKQACMMQEGHLFVLT